MIQIWETSISYIAFITIAAPFLLFAYYLCAESNFIITDNTTFMIATFGTVNLPYIMYSNLLHIF